MRGQGRVPTSGRKGRPRTSRMRTLPRNVWVLSVTSFLRDVASEMLVHLLPLFLANVLSVRIAVIGLIEGVAETTASLMKIYSGWLSDRLGRRKGLTVGGYGLAAVAMAALAGRPVLATGVSLPVLGPHGEGDSDRSSGRINRRFGGGGPKRSELRLAQSGGQWRRLSGTTHCDRSRLGHSGRRRRLGPRYFPGRRHVVLGSGHISRVGRGRGCEGGRQ